MNQMFSGLMGLAIGSALLVAVLMTIHHLWKETVFRWGLAAAIVLAVIFGYATYATAADVAIGDSIAVGTGHALHVRTRARVGAGSCWIADHFTPVTATRVVISAGINDQGLCVLALRARVHARRVVWVLPAPINAGRSMVLAVMRKGDRAVSYACKGGCTRSNFHPASYGVVAAAIRRVW